MSSISQELSNPVLFTLGPGFLGYIIALSLYGTALAQAVFYFQNFPGDSKSTKSLVLLLSALDTLHIGLASYLFWFICIQGRVSSLEIFFVLPWQAMASFVVTYSVIFIVQSFFCFRVWQISGRNFILTAIIALAAVAQIVTGLGFAIFNFRNGATLDVFGPQASTWIRGELISSFICDFVISAVLVYYFRALHNGVKRTSRILIELIVLSLNMGVLLCLVTLAALLLFELIPGTFISLAPHYVLGKLYTNSLMATLNSRTHFRQVAARAFSQMALEDLSNSRDSGMPVWGIDSRRISS